MNDPKPGVNKIFAGSIAVLYIKKLMKRISSQVLVFLIAVFLLLAMVLIALAPLALILAGFIWQVWFVIVGGIVMMAMVVNHGFEDHRDLAAFLGNQIVRLYRMSFYHIVELPRTFQEVIYVGTGLQMDPELSSWCSENLCGKHGMVAISPIFPDDPYKIWFSSKEDAILFKMRWL